MTLLYIIYYCNIFQAQPKHLSCIAVSAFHLSCQYTPGYSLMSGMSQVVPDSSDLTTISQSKCSPGDVARMERIIGDKLATDLRTQAPVTPLTLLRLLHAAHSHLAAPHLLPPGMPSLTSLTHKLEIIACDAAATVYRPSELSLALLTLELQGDTKNATIHHECFKVLYMLCKVSLKSSYISSSFRAYSNAIHNIENNLEFHSTVWDIFEILLFLAFSKYKNFL